ncbi:hypothetical protein [Pseudactinotalea terrae]|uniref:hypothetical protein n=1 Tax=Pseudactinotalea terrae TaxID=1743262 RepID=UPI0012E0FC72|nr:hypothetical protein [Pseudactinotalea terrae]
MDHSGTPQPSAAADRGAVLAAARAAWDRDDTAALGHLLDALEPPAEPAPVLPPDHPAHVLERHAAEIADRRPAGAPEVAAALANDPAGLTAASRGGWLEHHRREVALTLAAERLRDLPALLAALAALLAVLLAVPRGLITLEDTTAPSWAAAHDPPGTPPHIARRQRLTLTRATLTAAPPLPTTRWGARPASVTLAA